MKEIGVENLHIEALSKELLAASIDFHAKIPYEKREHVTMGFSPCNKYYTKDVVSTLVKWGYSEFKKVTILDFSDIYRCTLEAKGTHSINSKIKQICKNFDTKCKYALQNSLDNCSSDNIEKIYQEIGSFGRRMEFWNDKIQICRILDFYDNDAYVRSLQTIKETFEKNDRFKQTCLDFTTNILLSNKDITENHKLVGVKYLLHELPFLIHGKEIFGSPTVLVYHKRFEIYYQILHGDFPSLKVSLDSGFFVVTLKSEETESIKLQTPSFDSSEVLLRNLDSLKKFQSSVRQHNTNIEIAKKIQDHFASLGEKFTTDLAYNIKKELSREIKVEFAQPTKMSVDESRINIWIEKRKGYIFYLVVQVFGDARDHKNVVEKSLANLLSCKIFLNYDRPTEINFKRTNLLKNYDTQEITEAIDEIKKSQTYKNRIGETASND